MIAPLLSKRLIFVTGKGGVGKSTMSAALGLALAKKGRRVLIVETDAYSAMADLFSVDMESLQAPMHVADNLWLVNVQAEDALVHTIRQFVPSDRVARGVIQNRVARVFFRAAPSVNEFSILNRVRAFLDLKKSTAETYEHVIVDLPASGHAVTFLSVPMTLHGMIRVGGLAKLALELGTLIRNPTQCAVVAVALPEEMPVNETIELAQSFRDTIERGLSMVLLNMVHHEPFAPVHHDAFVQLEAASRALAGDVGSAQHAALARVIKGNTLAQSWFERDLVYVDVLRNALDCPIVEVPMSYETDGGCIVEKTAVFLCGDSVQSSPSFAS